MTRRAILAACALAALARTGVRGKHARAAHAVDPAVGPREIAAEPGAVVAGSFDELRALVADPNGPREICAAGPACTAATSS